MKWIHHRYVTDFDEDRPRQGPARQAAAHAEVLVPNIVFDKPSADGTHKWLLAMGVDGKNAIETVYIPDKTRGTLCVSSQVGCGLNCTFCSTATQGFNRNLTTAEIIGQVWVAARHLGNVPHQMRRLTNVVMMGMGEPLMNFDNVVRAMSVMRDDLGYGLANKRVTLSTSGLVPQIDRLSAESDVSLAVSLHAPNDALRETLVPLNKKYPIAELMASCARYLRAKRRESVTFEYTLMMGHQRQARACPRAGPPDAPVRQRGAGQGFGQGQPDPVQPVPGHPLRAFGRSAHPRLPEDPARQQRADHGPPHPWRRHRCRLWPAQGQVMDRTRRQAEFNKTLQAGKGSDAAA